MNIFDTIFRVWTKADISAYDHEPAADAPICGVYHVMCYGQWERMVREQMESLRENGLLGATTALCVSVIVGDGDSEGASESSDLEKLKRLLPANAEVISVETDARAYEYPALRYLHRKAKTCPKTLFYYLHTKGISYQSVDSSDRLFLSFRRKIESWCRLLEYYNFHHWRVAVNALSDGYDLYGCYRWPPLSGGNNSYRMYSGSYWWGRGEYIALLPELTDEAVSGNRYYSEVWPYERSPRDFSAFDTIADLYFVNIPRSIYTEGNPPLGDRLRFVLTYNWRKLLKKAFGINYKKRCQARFQKILREA